MEDIKFEDESKKYLFEFQEELEIIESLILSLPGAQKKDENQLKLERVVHSLKGSAGSYGFESLSILCHKMEDNFLKIGVIEIDELIDELLEIKDVMVKFCLAYASNNVELLRSLNKHMGIVYDSSRDKPSLSIVSDNGLDSHNITTVSKKRILIGETSKIFKSKILQTLAKYEVETGHAKDGYELLGRLLKEKFDILILSYHLPMLDADSIFKILNSIPTQNSEIKSILITSSKETKKGLCRDSLILEKDSSLTENLVQTFNKLLSTKSNSKDAFLQMSMKILLIDDSEAIHELIRVSFRKYKNIELIHCVNPLNAEEIISKENPHLILLDVQMPELSGDQLFAQLKGSKCLGNSLVVFLTAADSESELKKLTALGPRAILKKPFSPKTLMRDIKLIFEKDAA